EQTVPRVCYTPPCTGSADSNGLCGFCPKVLRPVTLRGQYEHTTYACLGTPGFRRDTKRFSQSVFSTAAHHSQSRRLWRRKRRNVSDSSHYRNCVRSFYTPQRHCFTNF